MKAGSIASRAFASRSRCSLPRDSFHEDSPVAAVYDRRMNLPEAGVNVTRARTSPKTRICLSAISNLFHHGVHERRRAILGNADIHARLSQFAKERAERGAWLGAYVLMPDHLHAFVMVDDERLDLLKLD